jgi:DNA polymerase-4
VPAALPRPADQPRKILHVDADAFFVAVARLVDPDGAGKAPLLIVGGGTRGVVCSASYEARQFGVRSAMPMSRALRLCPGAVCVPVPRHVCGKMSRAISAVLARYTPIVEAASIDEWYLDLTGTEALYRGSDLATIAQRMRSEVKAETGLSVSIGGGSNRLIAKLAVEYAKPKPGNTATGVCIVPPGGEGAFMARITLGEIPMVGPRFRTRLESLGLVTVADVLPIEREALERMLGERAGAWLHDRVRGIGSAEVHPRAHAVSLSHEETFARDLHADADLDLELVRLVTAVARDLRKRGLSARTVSLKLRDHDFRTRRASRTLRAPFAADRVLLAVSRELLARLRRARRTPARLLGVALTGLSTGDSDTQLGLFDDGAETAGETGRDRAVSRVIDSVRERFGSDALVPARLANRSTDRRSSRKR